MLGIRHFQGLAIDLWQGRAQDFVCDSRVVGAKHGHPLAGQELVHVIESDPGAPALYPASYLLQLGLGEYSAAKAASFYQAIWAAAHLRHLALPLLQEEAGVDLTPAALAADAKVALTSLREAIAAGRLPLDLKRITFTTTETATYALLQEQLFAVFPESF